MKVSLLVPDMPSVDEIMPYLREIDGRRWYTNFGPLATRLEENLKLVLGDPSPLVSLVSNATLGLELCLAALALPPASRILIPALTFVATASAVVRAGHIPILGDVDESTWLLTPGIARQSLVSHGISCVIPVATFGRPVPATDWGRFSIDTGVPVIVDGAAAFGNQELNENITVVFSFHATKAMGMGEGGLVATFDRALIEAVRKLSNFGIDLQAGLSTTVGTNAKMSEYHAAVGLAALKRWPERRRIRMKLATRYLETLQRACPAVMYQDMPCHFHKTTMQVKLPPDSDNVAVAKRLLERGIETRKWYLPLLDMHPAFQAYASTSHPVADALATKLIGLPFHPFLDSTHIRYVADELKNALAN
jgi:dTDP-4-amino-4,6-dideoxygalactose transaminase